MKIRKLSAILAALIAAAAILPVCGSAENYDDQEYYDEADWNPLPYSWDKNHPELGGLGRYIDDGYDLEYNYDFFAGEIICDAVDNWGYIDKDMEKNTTKLYFRGYGDNIYIPFDDEFGYYEYSSYYTDSTVRIPNTITSHYIEDHKIKTTTVTVIGMVESGEFKKFDVDPENKYMKCVDNVLFSKDGKTLMSYAQFDERTEYDIPERTEIIGYRAFYDCNDLKKIVFPSFDIKIDKSAFGYINEKTLSSYVQPKVSVKDNKLTWDKIPNASYYEIYQKLENGEYKYLQRTNKTKAAIAGTKQGKNYTFAVKAFAEIPAENYGPKTDRGVYPESFLIEGDMSDTVTITAK